MNTLIVKLGATGDVVRTTPLLEKLGGEVIWLTEPKNAVLLHGVRERSSVLFRGSERESVPDIAYDLIINLEDTQEIGALPERLESQTTVWRLCGRGRSIALYRRFAMLV